MLQIAQHGGDLASGQVSDLKINKAVYQLFLAPSKLNYKIAHNSQLILVN